MSYVCRGCNARFKTWAKTREHHKGCLPHLTRKPVPHESLALTEGQQIFNRPPTVRRHEKGAASPTGPAPMSHKEQPHG
jgi:hypothetical protein